MITADLHTVSGAHALHALPEEERQGFAAHLSRGSGGQLSLLDGPVAGAGPSHSPSGPQEAPPRTRPSRSARSAARPDTGLRQRAGRRPKRRVFLVDRVLYHRQRQQRFPPEKAYAHHPFGEAADL